MARSNQPPWTVRAEEILSDGEWHDGMALCRDIERLITPGVALRHQEEIRTSKKIKELVEAGLDPSGEDLERKIERRTGTLIAMGKRAITQKVLHNRLRQGTWVTEPSPLPERAWAQGGWRIRSVVATRSSVRELSRRYRVAPPAVRELILREPAIPHVFVGEGDRVLMVDAEHLPALEARLEERKVEVARRRSAASKETRRRAREAPVTSYSLTEVADQLGTTNESLKAALVHAPRGVLIQRGRVTRIPIEQLPKVAALFQTWMDARPERASKAMKAARRRGRHHNAEHPEHPEHPQHPHALEPTAPTPQFADPELTENYARYRAGETGLRETVFAGMREAFHSAEEV